MPQGDVTQLPLARGSFRPNFFEAVGNHHQGVHPFMSTLICYLTNYLGRHSDDGHIDIARNSQHRRIGLQGHQGLGIGIHGIDLARETTVGQTLEKEIADSAGMS